ncbi:MAG: D-glycero-beta-D-manno-heptose 1,7-bisphosphate 7-phosphatase [Nitrospinae bacterium]|nr:D-glycero-beta-D-manno-heptose 1,7-bisphosphate 7-phosphatase [Nitrospinota bacterium]
MKSNKNIAVFIDRDGTVSEEVGYLRNIAHLKLIKGSADAVRLLNERGLKTAVVTNQSGVARGYFTEEFIHKTHERLKTLLSEYNAFLDGIYYCPHHTEVGNEEYRKNCNCRKPNPGMIETAAEELNIDIKKSYVVGDKVSDVQLAHNVGAKGILVLTGYGKGEVEYFRNNGNKKPDYIANDLYDAVQWILKDIKK